MICDHNLYCMQLAFPEVQSLCTGWEQWINGVGEVTAEFSKKAVDLAVFINTTLKGQYVAPKIQKWIEFF